MTLVVATSFIMAMLCVPSILSEDRCASQRTPSNSHCTGCPPMHDGKLCASTSIYQDQTKASCGCGPSDPVPADWWTLTQYTAALDCKNLDAENPLLTWCPSGCGGCYELCTTGGTTQGRPSSPDVCHVFKITNRCNDGFQKFPMWCSNEMTWRECQAAPDRCKQEGNTNWFGYPIHFNLQDTQHQISNGLAWDNVEVTFEPVSCDRWEGPAWNCECPANKPHFQAKTSTSHINVTRQSVTPKTQIKPEFAPNVGIIRDGSANANTGAIVTRQNVRPELPVLPEFVPNPGNIRASRGVAVRQESTPSVATTTNKIHVNTNKWVGVTKKEATPEDAVKAEKIRVNTTSHMDSTIKPTVATKNVHSDTTIHVDTTIHIPDDFHDNSIRKEIQYPAAESSIRKGIHYPAAEFTERKPPTEPVAKPHHAQGDEEVFWTAAPVALGALIATGWFAMRSCGSRPADDRTYEQLSTRQRQTGQTTPWRPQMALMSEQAVYTASAPRALLDAQGA